ncbi:dephospho-CoA kinase [Oceanibaculum sp.]|uniref:dephospho-CoA kinase n=1 Tax=Oceanibaculum sp. TaxID=1903597 RepID=UPI00258DC603|nr:dephospho-CoA kinase [Oceanibaculum sp.]MCH2393525.1 dephospho-CoA kinase [Oceanibaculum sp.]
MFILGLTGSIGMGKTSAARSLRRLGVPVHDADATVHRLLGAGGKAVPAIQRLFPRAVENGAVNRRTLGGIVFADPAALRQLEAVLHPMVREAERTFLKRMRRRHQPLVVLDIPLLYETGGAARMDAVVVVSAPALLQARRVLARPGMTPEKFAQILRQQTPDAEKRRRADFVVTTGLGHDRSLRQLKRIVRLIRENPDLYHRRRRQHA